MTSPKLTAAVEAYLTDLRAIRASGGATAELSYHTPLNNLLTAVGATLKPKVRCVGELADLGAGHPDLGLYSTRQGSRRAGSADSTRQGSHRAGSADSTRQGSRRAGSADLGLDSARQGSRRAGSADLGLDSATQGSRRGGFETRPPRSRTRTELPDCGVVEIKPASDDAWLTADSDQVSRYWNKYRLVLVTNTRDFVLLGEDRAGNPARLETFSLADSQDDFEARLEKPRAFAREVGPALGEYLCRALSHRATLVEPRDVAWLLASYARDGLARVEAAGDAPSLGAVRTALEEALGVQFEGDRGAAFFRSTLVQTLFYGVFSAWVLWARSDPPPSGSFDWRTAVWHLRAPVLRALFQQLSDPGRLQPLRLIEVLDWTAAALDRVDRDAFFDRFSEGEAVQYFYEPFLEAFDPALRKQLGVWYTPIEVVRYMVARVDRALKDDLGIPEGLAADNVYVLDPCCGTGAYLAEVLRRIAGNLQDSGIGALAGEKVRSAATTRVFGFEIMPAPFVVAHLQVGLAMQSLDAPLADDGNERAGIFLTNALTGWEPREHKPFPFLQELEEERDRADHVKQKKPILVILGNPPYNGFAGMAVDEERELSTAYRTTRRVRRPEGQGLNDLYVRFFRMAERRIAGKTGRGVVCFISNYSWLDGLSFTGMRERYLEAFDEIRIDCLNGDKYRTGKTTPDGDPDPSIFSTPEDPVGIQVGTAITTLVRKGKPDHEPADRVAFRNLWGQAKREELTATAETQPDALYDTFAPTLSLGLPFARMAVVDDWSDWPSLPDLFPVSFPGVQTKRDPFLVDTDLDRLKDRMTEYFDSDRSHDEIARRYPAAMKNSSGFSVPEARSVRESLVARGGPQGDGYIPYAYRPFDTRWLYWDAGSGLLGRPVPDYRPNVFTGNLWLSAVPRLRRDSTEPQVAVTSHVASLHLNEWSASMFPAYLRDDALQFDTTDATSRRPNLSPAAHTYLERLGLGVEDLFHHVLAVLHDPAYREANAGALRMEWPRIPLPGWPDGTDDGAAAELAESADRGRKLAALLDPDTPVPGVTEAPWRPDIKEIAVPSTTDNTNMTGDDFALTAGWGHLGQGQAVMPGQGRAEERPHTTPEQTVLSIVTPGDRAVRGSSTTAEDTFGLSLSKASAHQRNQDVDQSPESSDAPGSTSPDDPTHTLGETTFDIYLNDRAYWRNIPAAVWNYKLGGYQVLKKWLSYREHKVLQRPLHPHEVQHFTNTARRIAAILELTTS